MPIKGLSDQRQKRMPRVGVIRLGIKAKNDKGAEYPKAVDYFVVKQDDSTPQESLDAFREVYGEKPREITIVFPTDEITDFADPWYRKYSQSFGLVCRGDGDQALARWDPSQDGPRPDGVESGTWANSRTKQWIHQTIPCPAELCPSQASNPPSCRRSMALQFILPDVRGIGVWQCMTGSWNSIMNVHSMAESFLTSFGRIRGVPFQLCIEPQDVIPPGGVKKKTVWVLNLRQPAVSMNDLFAQVARLPERTLMLPPAMDEEPPDDVDVIEINGVEVNKVTGEIVDEHEKRPEQPCKFCDVLLGVEDEWVQSQHGPGKCVDPTYGSTQITSNALEDPGPIEPESVEEHDKLSPWNAQPVEGSTSTANERGTPGQGVTPASSISGDSPSKNELSPTKVASASGVDTTGVTGPSISTTETVPKKTSSSPASIPEGGAGSNPSSISATFSAQTATPKSTPTNEAGVENRASRGPHSAEKAGPTPAPTTSAPDAVKSLACGSCGALIDLVRDSQADINSHQAGECRAEPFSGDELEKYKGWQPANVGAVLTQAWRLFKMDRPTAEGITGKLSPQMKPGELAVAWEKVFASKVRA